MANVDTEINLDDGQLEAVARGHGLALVSSTTNRTLNMARVLCPVGATGRLRLSLKPRITRTPTGFEGTVYSTSRYAIFVHEGTPRHEIYPRRKKALRFRAGGTGRIVFAARVDHPGTRAQPFLEEALMRVAPRDGFLPRPG